MIYAGMMMQGRVLDVGCNAGQLIPLLKYSSNSITEYVGIDGSSALIEKAMKVACRTFHQREDLHGAKDADTIPHTFYKADLEHKQIPSTNNYFDSAFMGEVLEHLNYPMQLLLDIWRVLQPGGIFVLSTPLGNSKGTTSQGAGHVKEYTDSELQKLLSGAGFKIQGTYLISQNPYRYKRLLQVVRCTKPTFPIRP